MGTPLDPTVAEALLASARASQKPDPTLTRDVTTWFRLNHHRKEDGCDNPDCSDPRPPTDKGRMIIIYLKGNKACCRFCFLAGWELNE